jgi:hypothetical protein
MVVDESEIVSKDLSTIAERLSKALGIGPAIVPQKKISR